MKNLAHIISTITLGAFLSVAPVITGLMTTDATVFDASNQPVLFQNIPACNAARDMSKMAITDGPAGPVMGQIVTGGGGSAHDILMCNGTATTPNWIVVAGGIGTGGGGGGGGPLAAMAAPNGTSTANGNTATMGNYANSCNGNGTSCLLAEDRFTGTQLNSNFWYPWLGTGSSARWVSCGDPNSCIIVPEPYSSESTCFGGSCVSSGFGIANYYNPFPYGYAFNNSCQIVNSVDDGDGNHTESSANGLIITALPGHSSTVLPAKTTDCITNGFDASLNAFNGGMTWTTGAVSSTRHPSMICPATGCYYQIRFIYPDVRFGAWPALWMMPEGGSGGAEFDLTEGGFNFQNSFTNTNRLVSTTWHNTSNTTVTGFNAGLCGNNGGGGLECQLDTGVDLSEVGGTSNWHVIGVEYVPGQKWTMFIDGKPYGQWTGSGVGNASYDLIMLTDMLLPGGSAAGYHTTTQVGQNGPFKLYINDVQLYKLPGQ